MKECVCHTQGVDRNDKLFGFQSGGLLDAGSCSKLGTAFGIFDTHKAYITSLFQGCHVFKKLTWDNNSHFSIFNMKFLSEEKRSFWHNLNIRLGTNVWGLKLANFFSLVCLKPVQETMTIAQN